VANVNQTGGGCEGVEMDFSRATVRGPDPDAWEDCDSYSCSYLGF
jgi:hypothetical protein